MSGQIQTQPAQYVGIINGIVYRIDCNKGRAGETVELVPLALDAKALDGRLARSENRQAADLVSNNQDPAATDAIVADAPDHKPAQGFVLFTRDGPEPLRAGHPDLWRLLVAGTCLEGSTFRSGRSEEQGQP
jgi:hypothetical protein